MIITLRTNKGIRTFDSLNNDFFKLTLWDDTSGSIKLYATKQTRNHIEQIDFCAKDGDRLFINNKEIFL